SAVSSASANIATRSLTRLIIRAARPDYPGAGRARLPRPTGAVWQTGSALREYAGADERGHGGPLDVLALLGRPELYVFEAGPQYRGAGACQERPDLRTVRLHLVRSHRQLLAALHVQQLQQRRLGRELLPRHD